ncbi:MAG: hypothetical protein WCP89_03480 [archaeon]
MGRILYVGGDDSNHAGDAPPGEFLVATFSFDKEDSLVMPFPNRRDYAKFMDWIRYPGRDYRFVVRKTEHHRHSCLNLPAVMPTLIERFIVDEKNLYGDSEGYEPVDQLNVYLDGYLNGSAKACLRDDLRGLRGIQRVVVDNFIKKKTRANGDVSKRPVCPRVVWMADVLANQLYVQNRGTIKLAGDPKMVVGNGMFDE